MKYSEILKHFDQVEIYEPDYADIRKFISMPRKVIFINRAARPDANIIRIGWNICDTLQKLPLA